MSRDIIYEYEFVLYPVNKIILHCGFAPVEIAKFIQERLTKKMFHPDGKEIFLNLSLVKHFELKGQVKKDDRSS